MPRTFQQIQEELKGRLKEAFGQSNPDYWSKLQGRPEDIERVKEVMNHSDDARRILEDNYKEERQERVAAVAIEVWNQRAGQFEYMAPQARAHILAENSILEEARKRAAAAHDQDLSMLNQNQDAAIERLADGDHFYGTTASPQEIAKMTTQEKATHFKAELHKLVDDANEARFQVTKVMNNERERILKEAEENGSEDPTKDVQAFQRSMYKGVQDKLHGDVHQLCVKYGYDTDRKEVAFLASPEGQAQGADQFLKTQGQGVEASQGTEARDQESQSSEMAEALAEPKQRKDQQEQ
ncbi:MAG: hypothetical protein AAF530_19845 [Pseudomonadota bacterium]